MQSLTQEIFALAPPGGLFDSTVVGNLYPDLSRGARKQLVHRALTHGEIHRLKPGTYCLQESYRRSHPHPFVVAAMLHWPSHISLESALAFHGLIPEAVHGVTSVTMDRSRTFTTPLGIFTFQRVPTREPLAGVESLRLANDTWALVARPSRAIADLVYLRKEVRWKQHGLTFLTESMRIDEDDLRAIPPADFEELAESFRGGRVREYLEGMGKVVTQ